MLLLVIVVFYFSWHICHFDIFILIDLISLFAGSYECVAENSEGVSRQKLSVTVFCKLGIVYVTKYQL